MLKTGLAAALTATIALSGVAVAQDAPKKRDGIRGTAVAACKSERTALGKEAFVAKYAAEGKKGKRAGRRCVRQHVRGALKTCRTERKADKAAFKAKYAVDGKRALRSCVRQHAGDPVA